MTEAKWLAWPDAYDMLEQCRCCALTERKLRLFACACCRRVWHLLEDDRLRRAIDITEQFADSRAIPAQLADARTAAEEFRDAYVSRHWPDEDPEYEGEPSKLPSEGRWAVRHAAEAVVHAAARDGDDGVPYLHRAESVILAACQAVGCAFAESSGQTEDTFASINAYIRSTQGAEDAERAAQANLLRDIFGNPYRPIAMDPSWLTPGVLALARAIDEKGAPARMPALGEALQHAGCDQPEILAHCHSAGNHVRGCWVLDAVLGKA
ncbi:MAG: hypothetical protein P4L84_13300 [Isosphaeraceae bacterium]|nr:hypothetical protein [Isosphaeraceae bacterium]